MSIAVIVVTIVAVPVMVCLLAAYISKLDD